MSLTNHDKVNKMGSGWYVVMENGEVYTEEDGFSWKQLLTKAIPINYKQGILKVGLKNRNKRIEIEGKDNYLAPGKRFVKNLSISSGSYMSTSSKVIERFIGYYGETGKEYTKVDITTGRFYTEIEPY